jgi:hypothetical protein
MSQPTSRLFVILTGSVKDKVKELRSVYGGFRKCGIYVCICFKNIFSVSANIFTSSFLVIDSLSFIFKAGIMVVSFVGCLITLQVSCMLLVFRFWRI